MSSLASISDLREAYRELSEDAKRQFWRAWRRRAQGWVKMAIKVTNLTQGGFREETILARQHPKHRAKLDDFLLSPPSDMYDPLPMAARIACVELRNNWVEQIDAAVQGSNTDNISTKLVDAIELLRTTAGEDAFFKLFRARALFNPEGWLSKETKGAEKETKGAEKEVDRTAVISETAISPGVGESCDWDTFTSHAEELSAIVANLCAARSIDVGRAHELVNALNAEGILLRKPATRIADELGREIGAWSSVSELKAITERLKKEGQLGLAARRERLRLGSLREILGRIVSVRINSRQRRDGALAVLKDALDALGHQQQNDHPCTLPGESSGKEWLRETYDLRDDALEQRLALLSEANLGSLSKFIEETAWAQLEFSADTELAGAESSPVNEDSVSRKELPTVNSKPIEIALQATPGERIEPPAEPTAGSVMQAAQSTVTNADEEAEPAPEPTVINVPRDVSIAPTAPNGQAVPSGESTASKMVLIAPITEPAVAAGAASVRQDNTVAMIANGPERGPSTIETIAHLVATNRTNLAGYYVRTLGPDPSLPCPAVFHLLALQPFLRLPYGPVAEAIRELIPELGQPRSKSTGQNHVMEWSSCVVPTLIAPMTGASAYFRLVDLPGDLIALRKIGEAIVELVDNVPQISASLFKGIEPRTAWQQRISAIATKAERYHAEARNQTLLYQPATEVWNQLIKHGPVGELARLLQASPGRTSRSSISNLLLTLEPGRSLNRLIQDTHNRRASGKKSRIEARAIPQFEGKLRPLLDLAESWLDATTNPPPPAGFLTQRISDFRAVARIEIPKALEQLGAHFNAAESGLDAASYHVGQIALETLNQVVDPAVHWEETDGDFSASFTLDLLCVKNLVVGSDHKPAGPVEALQAAIQSAAFKRATIAEALSSRLAIKDLAGAVMLVDCVQALGQPDAENLRALLQSKEEEMRRNARTEAREVRNLLGSARAMGFLQESEAASHESTLAAAEDIIEHGLQLANAHAQLARLRGAIDQRRQKGISDVRERLNGLEPRSEDRLRLEALADKGDLATVREYLGRLQDGKPLPTVDSVARSIFGGFTPERQKDLATAMDAGGDLSSVIAALRARRPFANIDIAGLSPERRQATERWLEIWLVLKQRREPSPDRVDAFLRGLGFVVRTVEPARRGNLHLTEVLAETVADRGFCLVPRFGSLSHGRIVIHHIWDRPDDASVVQSVGETANESRLSIVLYYGRISPEHRLSLAALCREKHRSFLVIDELLLVHLALSQNVRLSSFFSATIPFTYVDPFVTASSFVPPEMFFGRAAELAALVDSSNGRCFVYGGRQLGKTALLREAERTFNDPEHDRFAVWIDLLNHGIGREHSPDSLWSVLDTEFGKWQSYQHVRAAGSQGAPKDPSLIEQWLEENPSHRVLLLLDEADRFLDQDAKNEYDVARRLKGLMDRTKRRFKVVFAGLHNVQRTTQQANHPLAHLGEAIVVGSFSLNAEWMEAFALASEPLKALGFSFESPDLVTRILSLCNFYPGLIQQFCSRLWRRFQQRRIPGPPFQITERDVDEVYRDPDLRHDIVGRFVLTLQLDPRYWILAYVLAHRFHEDQIAAERGLTPNELRILATEWRNEPFSRMGNEEFLTLLDEMQALGVFQLRSENRFGLRNPNLLLLLGTADEVESKLLTGPSDVIEFTPRSFRARSRRSNLRRPLTLSEESRLAEPKKNEVMLVTGSLALQLPQFGSTVSEAIPNGRPHLIRNTLTDLAAFKRQLEVLKEQTLATGDGIHVIVVQHTLPWDGAWLDYARSFTGSLRSEKRFIRLVFETDPERLWQGGTWEDAAHGDPVAVLCIRKWPEEFIRPWLVDLGLPAAEEAMLRLKAILGGWPQLLNEFDKNLVAEGDWRIALQKIESELGDPQRRAGLEQLFAGKGAESRRSLQLMRRLRIEQTGADEILSADDIPVLAEIIGEPLPKIQHVLSVAKDLGLVDENQEGAAWDPIFERLLLRQG